MSRARCPRSIAGVFGIEKGKSKASGGGGGGTEQVEKDSEANECSCFLLFILAKAQQTRGQVTGLILKLSRLYVAIPRSRIWKVFKRQ